VYDNADNSLKLGANTTELLHCKFSWLSAKIRIIKSNKQNEAIEYDIDEFIEVFNINTLDNVVPTLYMVFMCWCAYTKHWFRPEDHVEFHIINDMGEEIVLNLEDHNEALVIKRNRIYVVVHSSEEETNDQSLLIESEIKENENTSLLEENNNKED
jgi:hypothetical protein